MEHTSPSRRARRARVLLPGLVALFIISLMATVPAASADEEDLADKIERRTGLSEESTLEDLERKTDPPGSDHLDSIKHKLSSEESGGTNGNETRGDDDDNDTTGEENRDADASEEGSGGNESGKDGSGSTNDTKRDLDSIGVDCPSSSTDSCGPSTEKDQSGSGSDDTATGDHDWKAPRSEKHAPSTSESEPDNNKDDALTKTATGSGIVMVLAWTLFVASTGPLGRSGNNGEKRQRPQAHLTPESQRRAQETESRANAPSRPAPSRRR